MSDVEFGLQRVIGLTGGIGTGKTTVSDYLADQHRLTVLDADLYAREAVCPGSQALSEIVGRYGASLLRTDGTLNRAKLAQIIFQDPVQKQWLEALIHPFVRDRLTAEQSRLADEPTLVMAIPLLFEAEMTDLVSEIWVVGCPDPEQLQRLMHRDHLTETEAQARIQNQWSLDRKCAQADVILDNSKNLQALYQQIDRALKTLDGIRISAKK
jgi:dephospho-CoA kinase